jgi:hypothetical protein
MEINVSIATILFSAFKIICNLDFQMTYNQHMKEITSTSAAKNTFSIRNHPAYWAKTKRRFMHVS